MHVSNPLIPEVRVVRGTPGAMTARCADTVGRRIAHQGARAFEVAPSAVPERSLATVGNRWGCVTSCAAAVASKRDKGKPKDPMATPIGDQHGPTGVRDATTAP